MVRPARGPPRGGVGAVAPGVGVGPPRAKPPPPDVAVGGAGRLPAALVRR